MDVREFFAGQTPSEGVLFSDQVTVLRGIDLQSVTNPHYMLRAFCDTFSSGVNVYDLETYSGQTSPSFLNIPYNIGTERLLSVLEEDALHGVGLQSFVKSGALIAGSRPQIVWFSHYWDFSAIGFVDASAQDEFLSICPNVRFLPLPEILKSLQSWRDVAARNCFLKYMSDGKLL